MVLRCTVMEEKLTNSDPFITSTNKHSIYTYCICSNHSAIILLYQWLPTSIQCGEAMARRRKEDGRVGSASRGMVRRWGRFFSRVRHRGVLERERVPERCHTSGAAVDVCSDAPAGRNRL